MKTYQIRFKPVDPRGIPFQVTLKAELQETAMEKAYSECELRELTDSHRFESIKILGGLN